jgi:hypothetical protein
MSNDHYRKLVQQHLDRMGVRIENRNPRYQQIDTANNLFERTADTQREAARRRNIGLPNSNKSLGWENHGSNRNNDSQLGRED